MIRSVVGGLILGLVAVAAPAQEPASTQTTEAMRQALAPFRELSERLPPELRQRLQEQARIWVELTPEEQAQLRENLKAWEDTPAVNRLRLRSRFEAWEQLDAATREAVLGVAQRYEALSPDQQLTLRERFDALSPNARQGYLFDPASRRAMELADTLFPFIPADQQIQTMALLRELEPAQLEVLRQRLARLPPAQRNAYRQELLDLDPQARAQALNPPRPSP